MFGEYDSESPRVPSPWDSLISSPRSLSPSKLACQSSGNLATDSISSSFSPRHLSPSPLLLPRLVPENDSGNVEYKLQLLNPSPARFARLVTQLKWRLLEGGGQAYYELGVADSGDLVGLGREQLESSLDTLEMMAGEIGASVIVVKEIEVPAELAAHYEEDTNSQFNTWGDAGGKRSRRRDRNLIIPRLDHGDTSAYTNTETEEDSGATDDGDYKDIQMTVVLEGPVNSRDALADLTDAMAVFSMDSELDSDPAETADISEIDDDKLTLPPPQYAVDLEIFSVYKPRPMRKRFHHNHQGSHHHHSNGQQQRSVGKRGHKGNEKLRLHHGQHAQKESLSSDTNYTPTNPNKSLTRRQARDRRREERKHVLLTLAAREIVEASPDNSAPRGEIDNSLPRGSTEAANRVQAETSDTLVEELEALHVGVGPEVSISTTSESIATSLTSVATDSTITAATAGAGITSVVATVNDTDGSQSIDGQNEDEDDGDLFVSSSVVTPSLEDEKNHKESMRLIVEVLVVRKMSIEEGFLDFEGFSFI